MCFVLMNHKGTLSPLHASIGMICSTQDEGTIQWYVYELLDMDMFMGLWDMCL